MNQPVLISCEFVKKSEQHGVLSYRVHNASAQDIFLFTPVLDNRGGHDLAFPERVYVYLDQPHEVHITKRTWPIPDLLRVYKPEVPLLTKVAAGKIFEETLQLPLPLISNFPYRFYADAGKDIKRHAVNVKVSELVFSIAYVTESVMQADNALQVEKHGFYSLSYGKGIHYQHLLTSHKIAVDINVTDMQ